tara:strand:+ start:1490 stop:4267 length:2778 start_codon:yes stop_codon:yes gene_type:complete
MTSKNSNLDDYLKTNLATKGSSFTHTRIGDKALKIYGGSYSISDNKKFIDTYYEQVFVKGSKEYLTEKQLIENGPILVDIDLRYEHSITKRQHTEEHILDCVMLYAEKCAKLLNITNDAEVDVYVMEKADVNRLDTKTKDGIHMIIGMKMHKALQVMLRNMVMPELKENWDDLPVTNSWDEIIDEGVAKGFVNWQLYGSRKPNHQAYLIKHHYTLTYNEIDGWSPAENNINKFNTKKHIHKLSARYTEHPEFPMKEEIADDFEAAKGTLGRSGAAKKTKHKLKLSTSSAKTRFDQIDSEDTLDAMLEDLFEDLGPCSYKLKETHSYTMSLPSSYYGPGSFTKWIRVGWALANTGPKMFLTWLKFSCQDGCRDTLKGSDGKFDWRNVSDLFAQWRDFDFNNPDGLTQRSIMYWSKSDALEAYKKIHEETIDFFIDQTIHTATEFDIANVLFHIFKDEFICISIKNNFWYEYINHRWYEIDSGSTLRISISKEMHQLYLVKIQEHTAKMQIMEQSDQGYENMRKRTSKLAEISVLLKKTTWKNNIMREARELFYDKDFMEKLDQNPYLLCFNNYVVDFKNKTHRKGQPDDYISKCTNIDYVSYDPQKYSKEFDEINKFMDELFPDEQLRAYMWEHLASCLVGTNENQTFNIYTGGGRNGKSVLTDLMTKGLGDYKATVPITLITQKRTSIGSTSSEIVQLKGTRYAVMQEPSKGDQINEGIMKEITGGDPLQGRALFKDTITFIPQFKLVVCTNCLFDIKSNDDGTWRRIRVCDFKSKFVESPYNDDQFPKSEYPHQYKVDKKLNAKFGDWAPAFMSMLVNMSYKSQGNVKDCKIVMGSSDQYREGQDYLAEFVKEKIQKKPGDRVNKTHIWEEFKAWYLINYGRGVSGKMKELQEYMNKRFGAFKKGGWHNVAIIYDDEGDEMDGC